MPNCKQCKSEFEITPEETTLREKICETFEAGKVPPPTQCPPCRMRRRMAWRNERVLYKRKCDKTGKEIISIYPSDAPFPVYDRTVWWGDEWSPLDYGQEFDFGPKVTFFEQFAELLAKVPRPSLNSRNIENSEYCNFAFDSRNCYLSHNSYRSESLLYCYWSLENNDCIDCSYIFKCERCYGCTDCNHSYNCLYCTLSHNCTDSFFLYDCRGCRDCFGCVGLRNKSFHMFNEKLSKEEYHKRLKEFDLQNPDHIKDIKERVKVLKLKHHHLYSIQNKTENCTGDYIFESKDCIECYQAYRSRDCMYVQDTETKDSLDGYHAGWSDFTYDTYSAVNQRGVAFVSQCWDGSDNFYSDNCQFSSHTFGSIGLKHKNYCILNKEYSKEEYLKLLPKIVEHMKRTGEWGEFFPINLSPFAYNESMAQENYPLTKEQVLERGWRWREPDKREYQLQTYKIPDRIEKTPDEITDELLACTDCSKNYKIIPQELEYYREKKLPVPRICHDCRYAERLKLRNPRKLWERKCDKCSASIKTTYSPESPEKIYCEKCYLKEIY